MRVCLVSHEYPPETADGGIGTQTWNKAHGLTKLGHDVEVMSCAAKATYGRSVRTVDESGMTVHRLRPPGRTPAMSIPFYEQAAYLLGYSWSVFEHLHLRHGHAPFDLINFPDYGADGFAFQTNRTIYNWVPVIVQLHAPLAMLAVRMGWPDKESRFYRTARFMEGESIRMADGWMASSANIADFVADLEGIPREQIDVVHCGVDCDLFRPADRSQRERRPTVLFVGNVAESKGIVTVFESVMRLRSRFPKILMRVVGKPNPLWERLAVRACAAGASASVEHVPYVSDREAIVRYFQQADVFASPADHENGVANVYVEAMACGCPVIAGRTGGAPEAVVDKETGILVPPRDVDATTAAIESVLSSEDVRGRMGEAARRRALEYFAQEKYIQRVLAAYERTIERSGQTAARLRKEAGL